MNLIRVTFTKNFYIALEFEPRDLWIGIYWDIGIKHWFHSLPCSRKYFDLYLTLFPLFPIHFSWKGETIVHYFTPRREENK